MRFEAFQMHYGMAFICSWRWKADVLFSRDDDKLQKYCIFRNQNNGITQQEAAAVWAI